MSFNMSYPPNLTPEQSGAMPDIIGQMLSGYEGVTKARYLQPKLKEELAKLQLENEYYPKSKQSELDLRNLQMQKVRSDLKNPLLGKSGIAGLAGLAEYMESNPGAEEAFNQLFGGRRQPGRPQPQLQAPPNPVNNPAIKSNISSMLGGDFMQPSQQFGQGGFEQQQIPGLQEQQQEQLSPWQSMLQQAYQKEIGGKEQAMQAMSDLSKKVKEYLDIKAGFIPGTNQTERFKTEAERLRAQRLYDRSAEGLGTDKNPIYDEQTGEEIGVQRPFTTDEMKIERGRAGFGVLQPILTNGFAPYRGKGAAKKLESDAYNYATDPEAKKRIDDYLYASNLITATTVSEMGTIGAPNTYKTYEKMSKVLPHSDVIGILQKVAKEYQLPSDAFVLSDQRALEAIKNATVASEMIPAYKKTYFNPEKHQSQKNESLPGVVKKEMGEKRKYSMSRIKETAEARGFTIQKVMSDLNIKPEDVEDWNQ